MINATPHSHTTEPEEHHYPREEKFSLTKSIKHFLKDTALGKGLVTVFAIAGLVASVSLANTYQLNRAKGLSGGIELFFSPATVSLSPNTSNYVYDIFVTTNTLSLSALDITIVNSNPDLVQITGINPAGATPTLLTKSFTAGSAHLIAAIQDPSAPFTGTTKIGTLTLSTSGGTGVATLSFAAVTQAAAPGQTVNALDTTTFATITVNAASSPTPSPLATTPPPTSTPLPSVSATPIPSPRIKPTPVGSHPPRGNDANSGGGQTKETLEP